METMPSFVGPDVLLGYFEVAECFRGKLGLPSLLKLGWALANADEQIVANATLG